MIPRCKFAVIFALAVVGFSSVTFADTPDDSGVTDYDHNFCSKAEMIPGPGSPPPQKPGDGSVWQVGPMRWTPDDETEFSNWVRDEVKADLFSQFKIPSDCAGAPAILRAIYARIHSLPAVFTNGVSVVGHFSKDWSVLPTVEDWSGANWKTALKQDQRFRKFLINGVGSFIATATMSENTYPLRLTDPKDSTRLSAWIRPGVILSDDTHTRFISRVDSGNSPEYYPITQMSSTLPKAIRNLMVESLDLLYPDQEGYGVVAWRWPVNCPKTGWKLVWPEQMPGYSREQYKWVAQSSREDALAAAREVQKVIDDTKTEIEAHKQYEATNTRQQNENFYFHAYSALSEAKRSMSLIQGTIKKYDQSKAEQRPPVEFSAYLQGLARGNVDALPSDETVQQQVDLLVARIARRVGLVQESLRKRAADPKVFSDKKTMNYAEYSTPELDKAHKEQLEQIQALAGKDPKGDMLRGLDEILKATRIDIGHKTSISLYSYAVALKLNAVSSDPNASFSERWGLGLIRHVDDKMQSVKAEITRLQARNRNDAGVAERLKNQRTVLDELEGVMRLEVQEDETAGGL